MRLHLHRILQTPHVTLGHLVLGEHAFATVELPWRKNVRGRSCVPCGFYHLVKHISEKFGETWALAGETVSPSIEDGVARFAVLFHAANTPDDLEGCIGVGREFAGLGVSQSQGAMADLRRLLAHGAPHYLTITRQTEGAM